MAKSDGRLKRFFLPTIEDAGSARKAARQGAWYAVVIGIVTAAITTLAVTGVTNLFGLDAYSYADAVIFFIACVFHFPNVQSGGNTRSWIIYRGTAPRIIGYGWKIWRWWNRFGIPFCELRQRHPRLPSIC